MSLAQVNHLSPLLLTLELLPIMLDSASASGDGRIVFLSSRAHSSGSWNPAGMNPQTESQYERMKTYGNTKLYCVCHNNLCVCVCCLLYTSDAADE